MVRSLFARFARDRSGVAFIIFAIMAAVIIPLAGGALDYGGALSARERLIAAADAAALAIVSKRVSSQTDAERIAQAFALAHYPENERHGVDIHEPSVTFNPNRTVTVTINGGFQTSFLPLIGIGTLPINVRSDAKRDRSLNIVMVVQNSNGLNVGIDKIKDAAKEFRKLILDSSKRRNVKIGLVPYAASVNVGKGTDIENNGDAIKEKYKSWLDVDGKWSDLNTQNIDLSSNTSLFDLFGHIKGSNPVSAHDDRIVPHPNKDNDWAGCVRARTTLKFDSNEDFEDLELDIKDTGPTTARWVALFARDGFVQVKSRPVYDDKGDYDLWQQQLANRLEWDRLFNSDTKKYAVENKNDWAKLYSGRVKIRDLSANVTDEQLQALKKILLPDEKIQDLTTTELTTEQLETLRNSDIQFETLETLAGENLTDDEVEELKNKSRALRGTILTDAKSRALTDEELRILRKVLISDSELQSLTNEELTSDKLKGLRITFLTLEELKDVLPNNLTPTDEDLKGIMFDLRRTGLTDAELSERMGKKLTDDELQAIRNTLLTDDELKTFTNDELQKLVLSDEELRVEFDDLRRQSNDYLPGHDRSEARYVAAELKANPDLFPGEPTRKSHIWFRLPGPNRGCVNAPIQPLTSDSKTVTKAIDSMVLGGNPITTVGLVWGWRVLSPTPPFTESNIGVDEPSVGDNVDQIIILFSNGKTGVGNSYSAYGRTQSGTHPSKEQLNNRFSKLCTRIKEQEPEIKIYTVNFAATIDNQLLLKNCASNTCGDGTESCNFPSDKDTITSTLAEIARDVNQLRLTH